MKTFILWSSWACAAVSLLMAVGACVMPWFRIPLEFGPGDVIISAQPRVVPLFKAAVLMGTLLVVALLWFNKLRFSVEAAVLTGLIAVVFPTATLHTAGELCGQAAWLQAQHRGLTWLGGDVATSHEVRRERDLHSLYLVDPPRTQAAVPLPRSVPFLLQIGRFYDGLSWVGYTDWFCQFAGLGWKAALFAGAFGLLAVVVRGRLSEERVGGGVARFGLAAAGGAMLLCAAPVVVAAALMERAQVAATQGDTAKSALLLESACRALPALREDAQIIQQQGLLDAELHRNTYAARLNEALGQEKLGRSYEAELLFEELWIDATAPPALRREAYRGLTRRAVNLFNSGEREEAEKIMAFTRSETDWVSPKALYSDCVFVALNPNHDTAASVRALDRLTRCYKFYNEPTKGPALAAAQEILLLNPKVAIP